MNKKKEIRRIASDVVYRNRWMTVREDTIVRPSHQLGSYGVIEKADFAVIAAVEEGQMYLVEQYRYPVEGRYWELPQGSSEEQQGDPLGLAAAELREETGLVAGSMVHAGHLFLAYGYSTQGYNVYLATQLTRLGAQCEPEEEGLIARAFDIGEIEKMIRDGEIKDATTVAAFGLLKLKGLL
ncbi:MAG TPA: NUDIX hydrolase [Burkholderiales bacterium]|nr:NUDIX hydrolase [Burkholderiales bacterium]